MPSQDEQRVLQVDHDSLRSTAIVIQKVADRLEELIGRTLAGAHGRADSDAGAPGALFDEEYTAVREEAVVAYASLVRRLNGVAEDLSTASANHRKGEAASVAAIRRDGAFDLRADV
ncbi:hypothetical protein AB0B45_39585 [Nonomuraea sp. NPDC049152]|uniref:hypothetical protein n=1 Tax=Nonomuraea sp. NPDC049152 TaxID=3154350 RepID=UPI0033CF4910